MQGSGLGIAEAMKYFPSEKRILFTWRFDTARSNHPEVCCWCFVAALKAEAVKVQINLRRKTNDYGIAARPVGPKAR